MYIDDSIVIFYIPTLLETSRPVFHQELLQFVSYPQDRTLCLVTLTEAYFKLTKDVRNGEKISKIFLSYGNNFDRLTLPQLRGG